jgi:general nucleoside transport system permease protein
MQQKLSWRERPMEAALNIITSFLAADFRMATTVLLAALGLIFIEKSGVVNIGVEGTMLIGALTGSFASYYLGSAWLGLLAAGFAGMAVGALFAFIVVTVKANQIVTGIAFNILALGTTTTFNRILFGTRSEAITISGFSVIRIPGLSRIPVLGPSLFSQMPMVYIALLLVPLIHFFMHRTSFGLKIRAVGEHPEAADTAGINVYLVRYATIIGGSFFAGIAGAYLSLGILNFFVENMVAGRGFIALAAVIFGKWNAWGVLGATLLFGFGDALQIRLQALGSPIPYHFLLMLPYLLTVAALAGFVGKSIPPTASGKPYTKN